MYQMTTVVLQRFGVVHAKHPMLGFHHGSPKKLYFILCRCCSVVDSGEDGQRRLPLTTVLIVRFELEIISLEAYYRNSESKS